MHICPSTQGKATQEHVSLLENISTALLGEGVRVIGYSMDGDSTYRKLHNLLYAEYEDKIRRDIDFTNFSGISSRLIVSDPLHILKRARYRLLGSDVHIGLTNSTQLIDVERLQSLLNLPSKVFSSQKFTKMHDDLPVMLFSFESLMVLAESEPGYLAYFLPFCLFNIGLSEKGLSLEERINFFEVAFYYVLAYLGELKVARPMLPDYKSARNRHVKPLPEPLARQLSNTLASILSVIYSFNTSIHLKEVLLLNYSLLNWSPRQASKSDILRITQKHGVMSLKKSLLRSIFEVMTISQSRFQCTLLLLLLLCLLCPSRYALRSSCAALMKGH